MAVYPKITAHDSAAAPRARRGRAGGVGLALAGAAGATLLLSLAGFALFVQILARREPASAPRADAIVVLTGGAERISDAMELLERGVAGRLLITGVNEKTTRAEIMRQSPERRGLIACCVDLDYQAQNTIGNAVQTRNWARERGFHSLLVVTSSYHMPRSLAELAHALPGVTLIPHPVVPVTLHLAEWWRDPATAKLLAVEYAKYLAALLRIHAGLGADPATPLSQAPKAAADLRKT